MFAKLLRILSLPRSLRWQFVGALVALELVVVVGGLIAVHALRTSADYTRHLAEERLVRLEEAQDLVEHTLLIEHLAERMFSAHSMVEMQSTYDEINEEMESLDTLVEKLGSSAEDVSVLKLHEASQLFRNTAHIVAGLSEASFNDPAQGTQKAPSPSDGPSPIRQKERLHEFHDELQRQAITMVRAAQTLSSNFTKEYRMAVQKLAESANQSQKWVLATFLASLLLAWLVYKIFLNRQILARLQQVSHYLRLGDQEPSNGLPKVPVQGNDEIGEMARAVEQFLQDRRRLAEANTELESFSYSVSHDLQAPLRAINGFSQILLKNHGDQLDKEAFYYLDTIQKNATRMRDLINDILEFSRMTRHRMASGVVDISKMAQEVFDEVRGALPKDRNITLRLGQLPLVQGDQALIRQVLVNLISNSAKFTGNQPEALIEFNCTEEGVLNTYSIRDNGIGFDMEYAGELFGVFQRIYGSEKFEGTGIGLAIVKRIIVRHGGRIWAQSKSGEGATFFFTLPSAAVEPPVPAV